MLQAHLYSQDDQDHLEIREDFNVHIQLNDPLETFIFFIIISFILVLNYFCKLLARQSSQFDQI